MEPDQLMLSQAHLPLGVCLYTAVLAHRHGCITIDVKADLGELGLATSTVTLMPDVARTDTDTFISYRLGLKHKQSRSIVHGPLFKT